MTDYQGKPPDAWLDREERTPVPTPFRSFSVTPLDTTYATQHLAPGAAEKFAALLPWLDAGAPHGPLGRSKKVGFSMAAFKAKNSHDYQYHRCGTACCIAGAIFTMYPKITDYGPLTYVNDVAKSLGMTLTQSGQLFYAQNLDNGTDFPLYEITPRMAAATIRRFLATGQITWDPEDDKCPS